MRKRLRHDWIAALILAIGAAAPALGQDASARVQRRTVWDLAIGAHARELSRADYVDFACGTNGGPPSVVLQAWTDFARCPAEVGTGLREVYFRYDDEREFIDKAQSPDDVIIEGTTELQQPVIVSGLFDADGFLAGVRLATDPRASAAVREKAANLFEALQGRLGRTGWDCTELARTEGETAYRGLQRKRRCEKTDETAGLRLTLEQHLYRRPGQVTLDAVTGEPTSGQFTSLTRFEKLALKPVANRAERLAAVYDPAPTAVQALAAKIRDCPNCDLHDADLKRADLRGAKLAGANLTNATLHAANLTGADLTGATLTGANLNRADLRQAKLAGADLVGAMLYAARLDGADLSNADLSNTLARTVQMSGARAAGMTAQGADFRYARLLNIDLSGADLAGATLRDAQLTRANLAGALLYDAELFRVSLSGADLTKAQAQGAHLTGADLRGADLTDADFTDADLRQVTYSSDIKTTGAKFDNAGLPPGFPQSQ